MNFKRLKDVQARDYDAALSEIKAGRKRTHWMWYIVAADGSTDIFKKVMEKFYGGRQDECTLALINA